MKRIVITLLLLGSHGLKSAEQGYSLKIGPLYGQTKQVPLLMQEDQDALERDTLGTLQTLIAKNPANANAVYARDFRFYSDGGDVSVLMAVAGDLAHVEGTKYLLESGALPTASVQSPRRVEFDPVKGNNFLRCEHTVMKADDVNNAFKLVVAKACSIRYFVDKTNNLKEIFWTGAMTCFDQHDAEKGKFPIKEGVIVEAQRKLIEKGYVPESLLRPCLSALPLPVARIVHDYNSDVYTKNCYNYIELGKSYIQIFNMMKAKQAELEMRQQSKKEEGKKAIEIG